VVPFHVAPPAWLAAKPTVEQPNFLTWERGAPAAAQPARAIGVVRFLVPVNVYLPGSTSPTEIPDDYLAYLLSQAKHGAHFSDQARTTVGDQPATVVTAAVDKSLDGSLGCPATETPAADCFGLQPELALRIAVLKVHGKTLLIWLRTDKNLDPSRMKASVGAFDTMLASVRFDDREVRPYATPTPSQHTSSAAPSALDGKYVMKINWAKAHVDKRCMSEVNDEVSVHELVLKQGSVRIWGSVAKGKVGTKRELQFDDTFETVRDQFIFGDGFLTAKFAFDGQKLTFSNMEAGDGSCGDAVVWTTKPWTRQ
jgi:hypothetical protein